MLLTTTSSRIEVEPLPAASTPVTKIGGDLVVAQVKSQHEKKLARELLCRGVDFFLPMREEQRLWGGRKRWVHVPLFPGVVFVGNGYDGRHAARETLCTWGFIDVARSMQPQLRRELLDLERALEVQPAAAAYPDLGVGVPVEVKPGHVLRGMRGQVERRNGRDEFVIRVETLGQSVSVEIDPIYLEPLN